MSLTTDKNDPKLKEGQKNETGQHDIYLVLSEEERSKGFVRPVRDTYVHVGRKLDYYKGIHRMLDEEEIKELDEKYPGDDNKKYVAVMTTLVDEEGNFKGGPYVTQEQIDLWKSGGYSGGCGTETRMGNALSETYARDPKFYGATYCCGCNKHIDVNEFVWKDTNQKVGS